MIKIHKPDVGSLVSEAQDPLYLMTYYQYDEDVTLIRVAVVTLAGWNREGRLCQLAVKSVSCVVSSPEEKEGQEAWRQMALAMIRKITAGRDVRDGFVTDGEFPGSLT